MLSASQVTQNLRKVESLSAGFFFFRRMTLMRREEQIFLLSWLPCSYGMLRKVWVSLFFFHWNISYSWGSPFSQGFSTYGKICCVLTWTVGLGYTSSVVWPIILLMCLRSIFCIFKNWISLTKCCCERKVECFILSAMSQQHFMEVRD